MGVRLVSGVHQAPPVIHPLATGLYDIYRVLVEISVRALSAQINSGLTPVCNPDWRVQAGELSRVVGSLGCYGIDGIL